MYLPVGGTLLFPVVEQWKTFVPPLVVPDLSYSEYPPTRSRAVLPNVMMMLPGMFPSVVASVVNSPPATISQPAERLALAAVFAALAVCTWYGRNLYGLTCGLPTTRRPMVSAAASTRVAAFSKSRTNSAAEGRP